MEKQLTDNSKEKKTFFKAKSSTKITQKKNGCNRNRKQKITGDNDKLLDKNAINSSTIILTASQKYLLKKKRYFLLHKGILIGKMKKKKKKRTVDNKWQSHLKISDNNKTNTMHGLFETHS